ncbi:MAG: ATP-binding protein [Lachnospiraceae bacterium]|nr:ATP-binding protein [Lachnospiraceae bacterium]
MLLRFRIKNYKSFADEAVFSMEAAPKQKGLDYSLGNIKFKKRTVKSLSSSVIYGPNASGKSNVIGAMDTLRSIVLRGHIRNTEEQNSPNPAAESLELIPNNTLAVAKPVEFDITFMENNLLIRYEIILDIGSFLDYKYNRKIIRETLSVNESVIFNRDEDLEMGNLNVIRKYLSPSVASNMDGIGQIAMDSLHPEELFLMNGFKLLYSQELVKKIAGWFANKFMVICRADSLQLIKRFSDPQKPTIYIEKTTNQAAELFGINSNAVGYVAGDDDSGAKLCSIFRDEKNRKITTMAAELFESYGTIRFITIFPLVIKAILTGGTLIVDEFDASIHPMALMNIITIFHNDDINVHHAQLIFNTHNPIFLNSNLLRRDEIKFVERDDDTHLSVLYALSDFGTTGDKGVRKHDDYMQHYFVSEYGAIKDIDFTPIFEEIMNRESEGDSE